MPFEDSASLRYFRWEHERSPYVIELSVYVVDRLLPEIRAAHRSGNEIGGLLIGSFPRAKTVTLRIENYVAIAHSETDDGQYDLSPEQRAVLSTARHRLVNQQTPVLGFFRSHQRSGEIGLSVEDRSFLNVEFRRAIHVALVISAAEPHTAGFFVPNAQGTMQSGPAFSEFLFDAEALAPLSQATAGPVDRLEHRSPPSAEARRPVVNTGGATLRRPWFWGAAVALVCLFLTVWAPATMRMLASGQPLGLSVTRQSKLLELQWNQHQPDLLRASSATLTITDGTLSRQWTLSSLEVKSGSIVYQQHSPQVSFTLSLHLPGSMDLVQSVVWPEPKHARP